MAWRTVLAGVDASEEGGRAAAAAWAVAQAAQTPCLLAHAVHDEWAQGPCAPTDVSFGDIRQAIREVARRTISEYLTGWVPQTALQTLEIRFGRAARVLQEMAAERNAGLIVLGAKREGDPERWVGGSTVQHCVRLLEVPLFLATPSSARIERVLATVDLSGAAGPTIEAAEAIARLFRARLRVMHSIEPIPFAGLLPDQISESRFSARAHEVLEEAIWPMIHDAAVERVVRHGRARDCIIEETKEWKADLVVVGSHGKGWTDRLLLGSLTETLLRNLPASLLVAPVPGRVSVSGVHRRVRAERAGAAG